ncbi:helix-turn-helix domain-containing protein, partial [Bradyrhizobium sp. BR 10261]|uniref:helix-turn-helix domain-containing protein n=1 Tax=Bradyrhizobium sp. BR 10261 TaxID=2749992 RepID=UPI001C64F702
IILRTLSLFVDGEGYAFVAIPTLAEDCDGLSVDTVRRRLVWLEQVGAIARTPQWLDENGVRNGEGRGKRTTDKIRLMYDADVELIEARAQGRSREDDADENAAETTAISPSSLLGLNSEVSPRPALGQPSVSPSSTCDQLISEPEPEPESPKAPEGGEGGRCADEGSEPDGFAEAWSSWPGRELQGHRRELAAVEFRKLSADQQRHCRAAVPLFAAARSKAGYEKHPNFHLWIRNRGFEEFPYRPDGTAPVATGPIDEASEAGRAITVLYAVARTRPFVSNGRVIYPGGVSPQILAFAAVADKAAWQWITDRQQIAAWRAFLAAHVRGGRPELLEKRGNETGFYAPGPWPPRKDGGWPDQTAA